LSTSTRATCSAAERTTGTASPSWTHTVVGLPAAPTQALDCLHTETRQRSQRRCAHVRCSTRCRVRCGRPTSLGPRPPEAGWAHLLVAPSGWSAGASQKQPLPRPSRSSRQEMYLPPSWRVVLPCLFRRLLEGPQVATAAGSLVPLLAREPFVVPAPGWAVQPHLAQLKAPAQQGPRQWEPQLGTAPGAGSCATLRRCYPVLAVAVRLWRGVPSPSCASRAWEEDAPECRLLRWRVRPARQAPEPDPPKGPACRAAHRCCRCRLPAKVWRQAPRDPFVLLRRLRAVARTPVHAKAESSLTSKYAPECHLPMLEARAQTVLQLQDPSGPEACRTANQGCRENLVVALHFRHRMLLPQAASPRGDAATGCCALLLQGCAPVWSAPLAQSGQQHAAAGHSARTQRVWGRYLRWPSSVALAPSRWATRTVSRPVPVQGDLVLS